MRRVGVAILVATLAAFVLLAPQPQRAEATPTPCDVPLIDHGCSAVGEVVGAVAGAGADAAGQAILGSLTGWVGDGASWLLEQVAKAIDDTTRVDLGASWFAEHYGFMFGVGAILLLPLLLLSVVQALLRQDAGLLVRAALLHLPAAMLLTGLAVAVTQTALAVTDALSAELTAGISEDTGSLAQGLSAVSLPGSGIPLFASFVLALFIAIAAVFVWIELVLRAAAIYIAVMFLPLFLAAMIWPATSGWIRRLVQLLAAAVLSKLVIVATLSLGLSAFASGDSPSAILAGAGMFMLAAFSPFVLFSLLPLVADAAQPQRESRQALAGATGASLAWNVARTRMAFGAGHGAGRAIGSASAGGPRGVGPGGGAGGGGMTLAAPRHPGPGGGAGAGPGASGRPGLSAATTSAAAGAGSPRPQAAGHAPSGADEGSAPGAPARRRPRTPPPIIPARPVRGGHGA
ncbi:type IV secretion system protein [Miltoncostaea oceani]|uniref:type IV secretion system protein n=1 Tax=Miltoncostaea oceani TaxID=2843216 RepID=UPI001C3D9753|nr:type IV secretion system protein [Miltoncostaea oceani]